jgi:hypothetical protein
MDIAPVKSLRCWKKDAEKAAPQPALSSSSAIQLPARCCVDVAATTRRTMITTFITAQRRLLILRHNISSASSDLLCRRFAGLAHEANATKEARLLLSGPDASGIVASFSHLLFSRGCGIVDCTSESSEDDDKVGMRRRMFFQRILFDYSNVSVGRNVIEDEINDLCVRFGMESQLVRTQVLLFSASSYVCSY